MSVPETNEHREIKDILCQQLKDWVGISIEEYPSSGHELDVFGVTSDGISIYIEIIWSDSRTHFFSDINMLQQSDADIKLAVGSPSVIAKDEYKREFSKVVISQRRVGRVIHDEMLDGLRILSDRDYLTHTLKGLLFTMIEQVRSRRVVKPIAREQVTIQLPARLIAPDEVEEQIFSNLLPVTACPSSIWSAPTNARSVGEILGRLRGEVFVPPFILKEKRLYTFCDLSRSSCPLSKVACSKSIFKEELIVWRQNGNKWNWFMELLNVALKEYCKKSLGLRYDRVKHRFLFMPHGYADNVIKWKPGTRIVSRTVAKCFSRANGETSFWRHYSAILRFIALGEKLYLKIEPGFAFTKDGYTAIESRKIVTLTARWMRNEFNARYFYHIRFWTSYLARHGDRISIPVGGPKLEIAVNPAFINMDVGIAKDSQSIDQMFERVPELFEDMASFQHKEENNSEK